MQSKNSKHIIFVARGIGITPFRSMIRYMLDTNMKLHVTLFYSAKSDDEFLFKELFETAEKQFGLQTFFIKSENGKNLDETLITNHVKDLTDVLFYVSGPQELVELYREQLQEMGATNIKTDLFTGYE